MIQVGVMGIDGFGGGGERANQLLEHGDDRVSVRASIDVSNQYLPTSVFTGTSGAEQDADHSESCSKVTNLLLKRRAVVHGAGTGHSLPTTSVTYVH
jgi:hypothetical protein